MQLRHTLLAFIIILNGININIFSQSLKFKHFTMRNGLSNNKVNSVIQDKTGFVWFGTEDGLNRFDGYNFKIFRYDPSDSNCISDNGVRALCEDKQGNIWIGTREGVLNKFDPVLEKFTYWKLKSNIYGENSIKTIYEDSKGFIWIGTYKEGLYRLNPINNKIEHWIAERNNKNSLSNDDIFSIIEDNNGDILVGTYNGLNKFNSRLPGKGFQRFFNISNDVGSISNNVIWTLSKSNLDSNVIWIGTDKYLMEYNSDNLDFKKIEIENPNNLQYGTSCGYVIDEIVNNERIIWADSYAGLLRLNLNSGKTKRFLHSENNPKSIISNQINKIIKDKSGVLWCATENGISYFTPKSSLFNSSIHTAMFSNTVLRLSKKNITAFAKTTENHILIGTMDGLYSMSIGNSSFQLKKLKQFESFKIWSIASKNKNQLWVGTYGKGLMQYDLLNHKMKKLDLINLKTNSQALYYNKSLFLDSKENLWIGYWGVGVARIYLKTGNDNIWLNEPGNPKSLSHNDVWTIKEDKLGRIWIGTQGGGLNLFEDKDKGIFRHWIRSGNSNNSLNSNDIYSIYEANNSKVFNASKTILWIGTSNGLNRFEIKNNKVNSNIYDIDVKVDSYTMKDGLPDNTVYSIIEDKNGNLWLGSGSGISFFDIDKKTFTNFSAEDGINGTMMNPEAALRLNNDLILFGSTRGLNIVDPANIKLSTYKPNLVFTNFQILNKPVKIGDNSPLKESIRTTKEIKLSYDQNVISFEFAALDFNSSESIRYAYIMEGFDKEWISSGARRFVTYTNLDQGKYIFKVKSTNADGVWNDKISSIKIIISPPWWKTLWAYGIYTILIFLGLFVIRRFELNRSNLRNQLKLKEFEVRKKSELEKVKSRFFANLSHEFRTPLMLITGPLENLKTKFGNNDENIDLIERNSNRLKNLIDQLLELSQLEKAAIPLIAKKENLIVLLKGLISSFESLADKKNIELVCENNLTSEIFWIDKDKFEKIINNLLSNALKFTPENKKVKICINEIVKNGKSFAELIISDTGIGISSEKIDKIFDRFFQVDNSNQHNYGGTGIGLSLVKELVELHKWQIIVNSEEEKGTEFIITIPFGGKYLNQDEKVKSDGISNPSLTDKITIDEEKSIILPEKSENKKLSHQSSQSILIVDDSDDVRKYLSGLLRENYSVSEAKNGEEGIIAAAEELPDLIISDVMMPSMDGLEFCNKIKSDWQTSDIPVILLTAKASFESKIEGLEIGADDYITKPFNSRELFIRIQNLLKQRKRLKEKFTSGFDQLTGTKELSTAEDDFIKKTLELIEKNIDKTNYGTEQLAKELFVSRTKLHRKILAITGQSPGMFVRSVKLK